MKFRLIILVLILGCLIAGTAAALSSNGSLYVASRPEGATILINGTDYGVTNLLVKNIPAGSQNLTLVKGGYQIYSTLVDVPADDVKVLGSIALAKGGAGGGSTGGFGKLYVASRPEGATILINGTDFGVTNKFVANVPAGSQNLTLVKGGYQPYFLVVDVPADNVKVLGSIALAKGGAGGGSSGGTGSLYVVSHPEGATILINGTDFGVTNKLVADVPAGAQNLTLVKGGYVPYSTVVDVPSGSVKILSSIALTGSENPPDMPGMAWPVGYGNFEACANARGIYYNNQLYVFSLWYKGAELWNDKNYGIQLRYFKNNALSGSYGMWGGKSEAEPTPLVVQGPNGTELMFIFVTGQNGNIYFTRVNGNDWPDDDWLKVQDSATGSYVTTKQLGWEVAPVYNPQMHRIAVYYAKDYNDYLYWFYSDDYGDTWKSGGKVNNSPVIKSAPGAVYYTPQGKNTEVLLSMKDVNQKIRLCYIAGNNVVNWTVLPTPSSDNIYGYGRPFLIDIGQNIVLMYAAEHGDKTYCSDWYIPHIVVLNKTSQQWGEPFQATYLPELDAAQGTFQFHGQPNAAYDSASKTFYLFYGYELCAMYTDETNDGPWWIFNAITTPGTPPGETPEGCKCPCALGCLPGSCLCIA